jgi:hypothetical protein
MGAVQCMRAAATGLLVSLQGTFPVSIAWAAHRKAGLRQARRVVEEAGDSEVREDRRVVLAKQDIGGFDVAVNDAITVSVSEGSRHRGRDFQHLRLGKATLDALLESTSRQVLHRQQEAGTMLAEVVDDDDLRMAEARHDLPLASESLPKGVIRGQFRIDYLECDLPAQGFLHGQIHGGHAASTQLALDLVARYVHAH